MIYGNSINEILTEATVYKGEDFSILVNGPGITDRNFKSYPYIKISRGNPKNQEYIRVGLSDMKYIFHNGSTDTLTKKESKEINDIMKRQPDKRYKNKCKTVWDAILDTFDDYQVDSELMYNFRSMETPPDFTKIKK